MNVGYNYLIESECATHNACTMEAEMLARKYALTGKAPKATPKGQAKVVFDNMTGQPELATTITDRVVKGGELKTRQDPYRVTLYYILVFKKAGVVRAVEQETEVVEATVADAAEELPVDATDGEYALVHGDEDGDEDTTEELEG